MDTRVEEFVHELEAASAEQAQIVEMVRETYARIKPDIEERFIYGGIGFFLNGELAGGVYAYKKHVSVVFSRGNELSDPDGVLEGGGKFRRHIKVLEADDVRSKNVEFFVDQMTRL